MGALEGIQVLDLSHGIAGPTIGAFLADFGAEVIKIEPPGGDTATYLQAGELVRYRGRRHCRRCIAEARLQ